MAAVPNPKAAIDENQYKYLTKMSSGQTAANGTANAGQQSWAKQQLAKSSYTPVPNPTPSVSQVKTTPVTNNLNKVPTPTGTTVKQPVTTSPVPSPTAPTSPVTSPTTSQASQYTDWQTKQNENYANLEKLSNSQFSYDPETDPGYQAQRQLAQLRAGDATKSTMEAANEKGIFGSSLMASQMGQIQQRAEQEAAAYIPEYRQQAYSQYQDKLASAGNLLAQSSALRDQGFNESTTVAGLTGYYKPQGADQLISQLLSLKGQAETQGITASDRNALSSQADQIRSQLQAMGMDTSALGANVNRANASTANIGTRTMAGQAQDYSQQADARDYAEGVRQYDTNLNYRKDRDAKSDSQWDQSFEYTSGRDAVADQKWKDEFDRITEQDGINNALAWASQNLNQDKFQSGVDQDLYKLQTEQAAGEGPTAADISQNISKSLTALGKDVDITSDAVKKQIEGIIVTQTQDPRVAVQLHKMYNIPIPSDLQALYEQSLK